MSKITYEKYSSVYEDSVIALLNICFEGKDVDKASFRWKHYDTYFKSRQKSMIARDGEKVVSFVCFNPLDITGSEGVYLFYSCSVQATHPDYRRRGLVTKLTRSIEYLLPKNTNYLGFSNDAGVQIDLHSTHISYQILGQMVTRYMVSWPLSSEVMLDEVLTVGRAIPGMNEGVKYEIDKNPDYLDWRFCRNPKSKLIYFKISKRKRIIGVAVLRNSFPQCELLYINAISFDLVDDCIRAIRSYAFRKGLPIICFTFLPNKVWRTLQSRHFLQRPSGIYFTVKTKEDSFLDSENWMIQGGDIQ